MRSGELSSLYNFTAWVRSVAEKLFPLHVAVPCCPSGLLLCVLDLLPLLFLSCRHSLDCLGFLVEVCIMFLVFSHLLGRRLVLNFRQSPKFYQEQKLLGVYIFFNSTISEPASGVLELRTSFGLYLFIYFERPYFFILREGKGG